MLEHLQLVFDRYIELVLLDQTMLAGFKDLLKDSIIYCQSESKSKLSTGKPPFLNIVNIF